MQKTAFCFGLYSAGTMLGLFLLAWMIFGKGTDSYKVQEVAGWASILLSVIFVYFGLKYYRDKQNGGVLLFSEGMKLGLLIVLFPALLFGLFNVLYIAVLDPAFLDRYYAHQVERLKSTAAAPELDQRLKDMEEQKDLFRNPAVQFIVMFLNVFLAGLVVTIVSTLLLKRKNGTSV